MSPERCAAASERRGDPLLATAAPAERFLLVEQPGAWGRRELRETRLDASTMATLVARCHGVDARLLLIRRAHRDPAARKRWAVVDARPGSERIWWGEFDAETELATLDPGAPHGEPSPDPVFLVCTHGRRDPCCAARGWPVAVALTEAFPEQTWQCSHVGGDRFAANVVMLPHGLYYGRLTPDTAVDVARRHVDGLVTIDLLRGRSCFPPAVQAAQHYTRRRTGDQGIDTLRPLEVSPGDDGRVRVRLAIDGGATTVSLREHESAPIPRLTCGARIATRMREWELLGFEDEPGS